MAIEIGIITTLFGSAIAISSDGTQRNLQVGDRLFADDIITTGAAGAVEIEFSDGSVMNLGRSSQTLLDNDVFDVQQVTQEQQDDTDAIQQALLDGDDPTLAGEATAASAGTETTGNEGSGVIQVDYEGDSVTPTSGFDTGSGASTSNASAIEEESNRAPEAEAAFIGTAESAVYEEGALVLGNIVAFDPDGDPITFELLGEAPAGLTFNIDGSYSFDPTDSAYNSLSEGEQTAPVIVAVRVSDHLGAFVDTTLTITVTGTNDQPEVSLVTGSQSESDSGLNRFSGQLTVTDEDLTDTNHTFSQLGDITSDTADITNLSVSVAEDGSYTLTGDFNGLAEGETAVVSFQYVADDGTTGVNGGESSTSDAGTVSLTITGTNDAPIATSITSQQSNDSEQISLDVSGNFSDIDGDALTYTATGLPDGISINAQTGIISGTLGSSASQAGPYTITVIADDGHGETASSTFNWTVLNPGPNAVNDTASLNEDSSYTGSVAGNDSDPDGDALSFSLNNSVSHGTLNFNSNGSYTYTPSADFNGSDSFTYTVTDADGASDSATVVISVVATSDSATIAGDAIGAVTEDASNPTLTDTGTLTITDGDVGEAVFDPANVTSSSGALGSLSITAAGVWTYSVANADVQYLAEGATKEETFTVESADGTSHDVVVTITGTNDAPIIDATSNITGTLFNGLNAEYYAVNGNDIGDLAEFQGIVAGNDPTATFRATNIDYSQNGAGSDVARADHLQTFLGGDAGTLSADPSSSSDGGLHIYGEIFLSAATTYNFKVFADDGYQIKITNAQGVTDGIVAEIANNQSPQSHTHGEFTVAQDGYYEIEMFWWDHVGQYDFQPELSIDGGVSYKALSIDNFDMRATSTSSVVESGTTDTGDIVAGISTVTGTMTADDIDSDDTPASLVWSANATASEGSDYGDFSIDASGNWTYNLDNVAANHLAEGTTVTETFVVTVTDSHGATDTENVTITIQGTNDAPVISGGQSANGMSENEYGNLSSHQISGQIKVSDVDASDALTSIFTRTGYTWLDSADNSAGSLTDTQLNSIADFSNATFTWDAATSRFNWTLDTTNNIDFLSEGDVLKINAQYIVTDSHGATDTKDYTLTLTGLNDAPTLDLDSSVAGQNYQTTFTEGSSAVAIADSDSSIIDVDDTHIESASIELRYWHTGDSLNFDNIGSDITVSGGLLLATDTAFGVPGYTSQIFTLAAVTPDTVTKQAFSDAIESITFSSSSVDPSIESREIHISVSDGDASSNTAITTIDVVSVNSPPASEDFSLDVVVGATTGAIDFDTHVSDVEDDLSPTDDKVTLVKVTSLPSSGLLVDTTDASSSVEAGNTYNLADLSYTPDSSVITSILVGARDSGNTGLDTWGTASGSDLVKSSGDFTATTTSNSGALKVYSHDAGHIGYGIADDDGSGINDGESITVSFNQLVLSAEVGFDGMGSYFGTDNTSQNSRAVWTAVKKGVDSEGNDIDIVVGSGQTQEEGGTPLFEAVTISIAGGFDKLIFTGTTVSGDYSYEVRYVEAEFVKADTFNYIPVDSDGQDGNESTVTLNITRPDIPTVNAPPETTNKTLSTLEDNALDVVLDGSDTDGSIVYFVLKTLPENGVLKLGSDVINANSTVFATNNSVTLSFVPNENWSGTTSFEYMSVDNFGAVDLSAATVSITVTPIADAVEDISVVIGDISYDLSGATGGGDRTTTTDGIEISSTGGTLHLTNSGLGIGVGTGTGEDVNRIDGGETVTFDFPVAVFPNGMQSLSMGIKNTGNDLIILRSDDIDIDLSNLSNISVSGIVNAEDLTSITLTITGAGGSVSTTVQSVSNGEWSISNFDALAAGSGVDATLEWTIDGNHYNNGGDTLELGVSVAFHDIQITASSGNGYQINDINFGVLENINSYIYPIDIDANLLDIDNSESLSSVSISGFPAGSEIKVVYTDGTPDLIITGSNSAHVTDSLSFNLDSSLLNNTFDGSGSNLIDGIFVTTLNELPSGFEPTIVVETIDGAASSSISMLGGTEDNTFVGGDGNDILSGGLGDDILTGGLGDDIFVWDKGDMPASGSAVGHDQIIDFTADTSDSASTSAHDVLDLSDLLSDSSHTIVGLAEPDSTGSGNHLRVLIKDDTDTEIQTIDLNNIATTDNGTAQTMLDTLLANGAINDG